MTEEYGLCGIGWKFELVRRWTEPGPDGQVFAFVDVNVYLRIGDQWSEPIPGTGGNMLVEKETAGLHANDEAFKMATTDALSTALKMVGVGADVYRNLWDGSKYQRTSAPDQRVAALNDVKRVWDAKKSDMLVNCSKPEKRRLFGEWVRQTLGTDFDPGINVHDASQWSRVRDFETDMKQCAEALK